MYVLVGYSLMFWCIYTMWHVLIKLTCITLLTCHFYGEWVEISYFEIRNSLLVILTLLCSKSKILFVYLKFCTLWSAPHIFSPYHPILRFCSLFLNPTLLDSTYAMVCPPRLFVFIDLFLIAIIWEMMASLKSKA